MDARNKAFDEEVICMCSGTTRGKVRKLFNEGMDLEAISNWSGVLSGCGGCEWDVATFINEISQES